MTFEQGQTMNRTSSEDSSCTDAEASNTPLFEATRSKGESSLPCGSHLDLPNRRPRWFCIETHPRAELLAILHLMRQQFTVHCPKLREWKAGKSLVTDVMFPGYLFVQFDRDVDHWRPIVSTRGVKRLFSTTPERPVPMPIGVVEDLMDRAGPDGVVETRTHGQDRFRRKQHLHVTDGPFVFHDGICTWSKGDRVRLLIQILGRAVEVELDAKVVRASGRTA
jgi:transcription antitermination factor NusG